MIYEMIAIFVTFGVFHKYFYSYKFKIQKLKLDQIYLVGCLLVWQY